MDNGLFILLILVILIVPSVVTACIVLAYMWHVSRTIEKQIDDELSDD